MKWIKSEWKYLKLTVLLGIASLIVILIVSLIIVNQLASVVSVPLPEYMWLGIGIIGWILFAGYFLGDRIHYVPLRKIHIAQTANGEKRFLRGGLRGLRPGIDELQKDPNDPKKIWEIDLQKALIPIGRNKDGDGSKIRIFTTGDKPRQPVAVRYEGLISPDDSTDESLARWILYGADVRAQQFEALIDQNFSDRIAKSKQKEILSDKAAFTAAIEAMFKSVPGAIHEGHEKHFGSKLDSFAIKEVDLDPDILAAMKAGTEMAIFTDKVEALVKRTKDAGSQISGDEAFDGFLILAGKKTASSQTVTYEGLDKLSNLTVFAPGGSGKFGVVADGKGNKNKKGN